MKRKTPRWFARVESAAFAVLALCAFAPHKLDSAYLNVWGVAGLLGCIWCIGFAWGNWTKGGEE